MGFIHGNIIPILKEGAKNPFSGKLLLLGQGDIYFDIPYLRKIAKSTGFQLNENVPFKPSHLESLAAKGYPHCETVFKMLGFSEIETLDYSQFEGANIVFDLNQTLPQHLQGKYDMVIDHGTLEHVFNFPGALKNVYELLKIGGRAVFSAPSGNFFDHGFYMLQPTLFLDWLTANLWNIHSIQIVQFTPDQENEPAFFTDYIPGMFTSVSYGKVDNKLYATVSIAEKIPKSTGDVYPQQGFYASSTDWK